MATAKEISEKLKGQGFRSTSIRKAILSLLLKSKKPVSCQEILKMLKAQRVDANKTTVYREMSFLKLQGMAEELQFNDGVKRYEITSGHHHHIICLNCEKVECVKMDKDLSQQERKIEKNKKFKIINHSLEFYGFCRNCQANKK